MWIYSTFLTSKRNVVHSLLRNTALEPTSTLVASSLNKQYILNNHLCMHSYIQTYVKEDDGEESFPLDSNGQHQPFRLSVNNLVYVFSLNLDFIRYFMDVTWLWQRHGSVLHSTCGSQRAPLWEIRIEKLRLGIVMIILKLFEIANELRIMSGLIKMNWMRMN